MNTNHNPNEELTDGKTPRDHQEQTIYQSSNTRPRDDRRDDIEHDEDDLDEKELDERRDWGDVDPAGGEAPTSPGSAV
ncbi:hypothetical protein [Flavobacterium soli]|uniref:hypothetical protein n=1 Tax=Flavobacterium soli TaxID=344881 RepID=UPI0004044E2B|nr:hypothetical protein [Flavobacterium soli]